jgi:hypothetical protein
MANAAKSIIFFNMASSILQHKLLILREGSRLIVPAARIDGDDLRRLLLSMRKPHLARRLDGDFPQRL